MLIKTAFLADMSGKVGGVVASHNAGGAYLRLASIPTNPNTVFQQVVRTAVALLSGMWETGLTQAQRDGWDVYAKNTKVTNRIGEQVSISGIAHLVRSNVTRNQNGLPLVLDAPTVFNLGTRSGTPVSNATAAAQTMDVSYLAGAQTDPWANETGSYMFVYVGRPQNAGVTFFKGPYRLAGSVQGDPVPPAAPLVVTSPFPFVAGQRIFIRSVVSYADGRYTTSYRDNTIAVA